jgi:hypothetical protein
LRTKISKRGVIAWDTLVAKIDDNGQPFLQKDTPSPSGSTSDRPILQTCGVQNPVFK